MNSVSVNEPVTSDAPKQASEEDPVVVESEGVQKESTSSMKRDEDKLSGTPAASASPTNADGVEEECHVGQDNTNSAPKPEINPEEAEDEEVRIAMEMAMAAAQNPKLSPAELRKLVAQKNKQVEIVDKIQEEKNKQIARDKEEQWNKQKETAIAWWKGKTAHVSEMVAETSKVLTAEANKKAEQIRDEAEKRMYAEDIKMDLTVISFRKQIKVAKKNLKAQRLQTNRDETRHAFKRQRMEKDYMALIEKVQQQQRIFVGTNFNIHRYAKSMLSASKKWKKEGSDEELTLEAQLCRNMHQMLAIEKQKAKMKKSSRELKKYLQRCKSWLSDKKAFCEMQTMTLGATTNSMKSLYEETLDRQDALIKKLIASKEFEEFDRSAIQNSPFDNIPVSAGPGGTLSALRGLPINDSLRLNKRSTVGNSNSHHHQGMPPPERGETTKVQPRVTRNQQTGRPELIIEARTGDDDISINSQLTDPDEPDIGHESDLGDDQESDEQEEERGAPWSHDQAPEPTASMESNGEGEVTRTVEKVVDSTPMDNVSENNSVGNAEGSVDKEDTVRTTAISSSEDEKVSLEEGEEPVEEPIANEEEVAAE